LNRNQRKSFRISSLTGNLDWPEPSITGLKYALEHAMKNSLVYVLTDATAKDYNLKSEVLKVVQKKQVKVSFIITGDAGTKTDPGYQVFVDIASASEGQVFVMSRDIIKSVLKAITQALDPKFEPLASINSDKAGSMTKRVSVDRGFSSLSVSLSGTNSKLTVKDGNNVDVKSKDSFSSDNIKFLTFDVIDSAYTIEASADSAYSIRVGGISELKIEFGFSTNYPSEQAETSTQPLLGFKNILSIFISDHGLVKCLKHATLLPANPDQPFEPIEIPLERTKRDIYSSEPFEIPPKMFKIRINGYDIKGKVIERLISSGIESVVGCECSIAS
jgi:hemicentin